MGKYAMTRNQQKFRKETFGSVDWDDYDQLQKWSSVPFIGGIFETRMKVLAYEENKKFWEDYARNTGFDIEDITYPIRTGLYGNYTGFGDYIEASTSVVNLFDRNLLKW